MKFKSIKTKIVLIFSILIMLVVSTLYFVSDINITNLANERVLDKMDSISKIGYDLLENTYDGQWKVEGDKLYKGDTLINDDFYLVDNVKNLAGAISTIFLGDTKQIYWH